MKAQELANYILGRAPNIELMEPSEFKKDANMIRKKILSLTPSGARGLGLGKSTFFYLRERAQHNHRLLVREKTRRKLEMATPVPVH
jgi:hypothetical protein